MLTTTTLDGLKPLIEGCLANPFEVLGPHEVQQAGRRAMAVRAFLPQTNQAWVVDATHGELAQPMRRIHPAGVFEAICPFPVGDEAPDYLLRVADAGGKKITMHDPYAFPHLLTDYDLHLLNEGRHWKCYERLGAHLRTIRGVEGVNFAVWAPNATGISVVGDFNNWDARRHPMRKHIPSGFWELFVPGLSEGTLYKYQVRQHDRVFEKSDPVGFAAEVPPPRRRRWWTWTATAGTTSTGWRAPRHQLAGKAPFLLRGTPGQLAAARRRPDPLAELSRVGPPVGRLL